MNNTEYIVKLGGSVITEKDKAMKINYDSLCRIGSYLRKNMPKIIVHGGGSYGHYIVHGILEKKKRLDYTDLPLISYVMDTLNREVIKCLQDYGLPVVSFPPHSICSIKNNELECETGTLKRIVEKGLIPVLYGDAVVSTGGIEILSGDTLMVFLAREYGLRKLVFLTDVDGVYVNMDKKTIIKHLNLRDPRSQLAFLRESNNIDVTGGMRAKIESLKNLPSGTLVYIVNGRKESHLSKVFVEGENPGTLIET
ncbi:MAG: isopentenyl phosphate kinase family protein [Desulfurococcales archaeon]|nr:isopentenyl phosphate kinase family protein [Desulfurococcales archaeon]